MVNIKTRMLKKVIHTYKIVISPFNYTSRNVVAKNFSGSKFSDYPRKLDKEINTAVVDQNDRILENIKSAANTSDVLHIIQKHNLKISNPHLIQAFRSIFGLQKNEWSDMSNDEVMRSAEFQILCNNLKTQVRLLRLDETIDILKALSYLGVPTSSKLVQILLQFITKQVNDLSLHQIIFLDFLLTDFESCPLVEALKIALPIIFEAHIKTKADTSNISYLTDLFHYSTKKNMSTSVNNFLIKCLIKLSNNIDFKSAKSIVRSLSDLNLIEDSHRVLLLKALDVIVYNKKKCKFIDIDTLLSQLCSKFSWKNVYFYHDEFLKTATGFVIENNCSFEEGVWILKKASKFNYINIKLLDYLAVKLERDHHALDKCGSIIIFSFVGGLAHADYRPPNWNIIEPIILKNAYLYLNQVELPWVKFARDLCTLDCWSFKLFRTIFDPEFLEKYLSRDNNTLDHIQLLSLYQSVSTLCPWYNGPKMPESIMKKAMELNRINVREYPLKQYLVFGLGGEKYVFSGVYTRMGHFIDHLILLQEDGTAVPFPERDQNIDQTKLYIEDFHIPNNCKMVAVLYLPSSCYCINTNRLKGPHRLGINSLQMTGPIVVPIDSMTWMRLLDQEKIPYLMQFMRDKYFSTLQENYNNEK